jgi:hypothetical protein
MGNGTAYIPFMKPDHPASNGRREMLKQIIKTSGNRAVVINVQEGSVWACLYVNARNGLEGADITNLRWTGATIKGAEKWAAKQLAA